MLSWIILILVLILLSIIGVKLFATVFGRGEALPPMPPTAEVKEANRRAVEEGNFGDIQLEVVHRGYRMDQVDALLDQQSMWGYLIDGHGLYAWGRDMAEARRHPAAHPDILVTSSETRQGIDALRLAVLEDAAGA